MRDDVRESLRELNVMIAKLDSELSDIRFLLRHDLPNVPDPFTAFLPGLLLLFGVSLLRFMRFMRWAVIKLNPQ